MKREILRGSDSIYSTYLEEWEQEQALLKTVKIFCDEMLDRLQFEFEESWISRRYDFTSAELASGAMRGKLQCRLYGGIQSEVLRALDSERSYVMGGGYAPCGLVRKFVQLHNIPYSPLKWFRERVLFLCSMYLRVLKTTVRIVAWCFLPKLHSYPNECDIVLVGYGGDILNEDDVAAGQLDSMPSWINRRFQSSVAVLTSSATARSEFAHDVRSVTVPFPKIGSLVNRLKLMFLLCWLILAGGKDLVLGRGERVLILGDLMEMEYLRASCSLPKKYLYTNSTALDRRLWASRVAFENMDAGLLFYSMNNEPMVVEGRGQAAQLPGWQFIDWDTVFVWNRWHQSWVESLDIGCANIETSGPVPLYDVAISLPKIKPSIAVFDVSPYKKNILYEIGLIAPYSRFEISELFFEGVISCCRDLGLTIVFKQKRESPHCCPHYLQFLEELTKMEQVVVIDSRIAASRVIRSSNAVVSLPFTSTSIWAKELGVPGCYFDPTGLLDPKQRAAQGVDVLGSREILMEWLGGVAMDL